jgi:hypothetical protein
MEENSLEDGIPERVIEMYRYTKSEKTDEELESGSED